MSPQGAEPRTGIRGNGEINNGSAANVAHASCCAKCRIPFTSQRQPDPRFDVAICSTCAKWHLFILRAVR